MTNRDYSGGARVLALSTAIGPTATTFEVDQVLGTWPLGSADGTLPFFIVINRNTPIEEKVLVRQRSGTTFTIVAGGRGADDTAAASHGIGATVEHVWTATDARESNRHVNANSGVHGLTPGDSVVGQAELNAAVEAERVARIADVDAEQTAREAADNAIIASIGQNTPVGTMVMWPAASAPSGWSLCRGQNLLRADFPELFALIGTAYGNQDALSFRLPDLSQRVPRGMVASDSLNDRGGAASVTLTDAMVPLRSHAHTINHDHTGGTALNSPHTHNGSTVNDTQGGGTVPRFRNAAQGGTTTVVTNEGSGQHSHAVAIPNFQGNSGAASAATSAPVPTLDPFIVLNFIIKNSP